MGGTRSIQIGVIALGLGAVALLAGCSSSPSTSSTTTSSTSSSSGSGTNGAAPLSRFQSQLTNGNALTYRATYSLNTPGTSGTFVVERMPPGNTRFDVSTSGQQLAIIANTTATYICDLSKAPTRCVTGIQDPLASFEMLVNPAQIIPSLQQAAANGTKNVTFSSQTVYGMAATCATITSGHQGTFCVTSQGLLVSVTAANGSLTLTGYTTSVPASDFSPPAGATANTLPVGTAR